MALTTYARKRDFAKTPEPRPTRAASEAGRRYVVQKHDASRLHYDFRLELDGALKSWAVPKGPSLNPADKRLAVEVEDHPLAYASFEGVIPQGQYGGGAVMIWDRGTWSPTDPDPAAALRRGKLSFTLDGERLRGGWTLTRIRGRDDGDRNNWLLIKRDDDEARRRDRPITEAETTSAATGRDLERIAADGDAVWTSETGHGAGGNGKLRAGARRVPKGSKAGRAVGGARGGVGPSAVAGAVRRAMPRDPRPQLCTLAGKVPSGDGWLHEIKFDGYRLIARRDKRVVRLFTRSGKDWTGRFGPIAAAIAELPVESALIDGEATIVGPTGHTSFQKLQQAIKERKYRTLVFFAFDLLYCNGFDLMRTPLVDRKALLRSLVPDEPAGVLRYSDHVRGGGQDVQANACTLGLEGVVSKRVDAPYTQGRSRSWIKVKCGRRQEFIVVGWTKPSGARRHFGSLALGAHDAEGKLVYTGRVGTGFTAAALSDLAGRLAPLARTTSPLDRAPPRSESRGVHWVRPELVAEVAFTEWTDDGRLRHPSYQGLREDKEAAAVKIETPATPADEADADVADEASAERIGSRRKRSHRAPRQATAPSRKAASPPGGADGAPMVAGVTISSPGRVVFPDEGLTKLDVARYYEHVADLMLPFLRGRPLSTVRCPQGRGGQCFFQKHRGATFAAPVRSIRVREKDASADYISVDSVDGLVTLIQFGVLEVHPWGSREDRIEQPDQLIFDLDPGEGVAFDAVKLGARRIREVLASVDLESFVKTSGGKGLHVVAPLRRRADWDEAKAFARAVADRLARDDPERFIATMSKQKRRGRVYVDYLRNSRGATSVAPYSTRARPHAPVSMPVLWSEADALETAADFTVANTPRHLQRRTSDPWRGFFKSGKQLTSARLGAITDG